LLVLTPDWLKSEWNIFESLLLQTSDPTGFQQRIVPLMLKKCDLPKRLSIFTYADLTQPVEMGREFERIVKAIKGKGLTKDT